jgi:predicted  nucleic acid-binding Zn-ribbon protein
MVKSDNKEDGTASMRNKYRHRIKTDEKEQSTPEKHIQQEIKEFKPMEDKEETKTKETEINKEITEAKQTIEKAKENIELIQKERDEFAKTIDRNILSQYERIRESRNGQGIAIIDGESCGGCNMVLRPQLIVQATKCKELVYCDNCSRILFNKKGIQE